MLIAKAMGADGGTAASHHSLNLIVRRSFPQQLNPRHVAVAGITIVAVVPFNDDKAMFNRDYGAAMLEHNLPA
jgi:hypothetical protein